LDRGYGRDLPIASMLKYVSKFLKMSGIYWLVGYGGKYIFE
jgi:hypothetical protein